MPKLAVKEANPILPDNFPFVDTRSFRKRFQLGKTKEAELRRKLSPPLYWIQPDRKVLWNWVLVQDYLLHGDGPQHQRLVETYLKTLPGT